MDRITYLSSRYEAFAAPLHLGTCAVGWLPPLDALGGAYRIACEYAVRVRSHARPSLAFEQGVICGHGPSQGNPATGRPKAPWNMISLSGRLEVGCSIARYFSGRFSAGARRPIAIMACTSKLSGIESSVFARA